MRSLVGPSVLLLSVSAAAGGWVGNSPMNVAYHPADAFRMSERVERRSQGNSLLRSDDESYLAVGFGVDQHHPYLRHEYGITDDWTLVNLTSVGYNVVGNDGSGHEVAVFAGMPNFGWSTMSGFEGQTMVAAVHSYRDEDSDWKFTNSVSVEGNLRSKGGSRGFGRVRSGVARRLGEKWSAGASVNVIPFVTEPCVTVTRRLGESSSMSVSYTDTSHVTTTRPPTDVYVALETTW